MRLSIAHNTPAPAGPSDAATPDLSYLKNDFADALQSFFATVGRIIADNPVSVPRLQELAAKAAAGPLTADELRELESLKAQALRQGKAVGAVVGFFLKFKPSPTLEEIRQKGKLFQPAFGPVLVVDGDAVRDVLQRNDD